jgi:hypothetical protein
VALLGSETEPLNRIACIAVHALTADADEKLRVSIETRLRCAEKRGEAVALLVFRTVRCNLRQTSGGNLAATASAAEPKFSRTLLTARCAEPMRMPLTHLRRHTHTHTRAYAVNNRQQ